MHYRGILLCNTCPGSIYEHEVYYESHRLCKSEAMLVCVGVCVCVLVLPSFMLTVLSVVFLCDRVCEHMAVGFTFWMRKPDAPETAGPDFKSLVLENLPHVILHVFYRRERATHGVRLVPRVCVGECFI